MKWDEIKDFRVGRPWTHTDLKTFFASIRGGVAAPREQDGCAVVAALRPPRDEGQYEIHVLAEFVSSDLRELLLQCSALSQQYGIRQGDDDSFYWFGDSKDDALYTILTEINESRKRNTQAVLDAARSLDLQSPPYQSMVPILKDRLDPKHQKLFLHGSTLEERLHQIDRAEHLPELRFGAHPAIEALAFVLEQLEAEAKSILWNRLHPPESRQRDWDPLTI